MRGSRSLPDVFAELDLALSRLERSGRRRRRAGGIRVIALHASLLVAVLCISRLLGGPSRPPSSGQAGSAAAPRRRIGAGRR